MNYPKKNCGVKKQKKRKKKEIGKIQLGREEEGEKKKESR